MCKEPAKSQVVPGVLVRFTTGEAGAQLVAVGISRYAAGVDACPVTNASGEYAEVMLLPVNPEKTDLVDDLTKLERQIRTCSGKKDAFIGVEIVDGVSISASFGEEFLGELASLPVGDLAKFDMVEDAIDRVRAAPPSPGPILFTNEELARFAKIADPALPTGVPQVLDMVADPDSALVAVRVGPTFHGVIAAIGREGFEAGGSWKDRANAGADVLFNWT